MLSTLRSSFLAGVCIGIAGFCYLAEKSVIGAILFAFGLLAVVHYKLKLFTGTAGFFKKGEFKNLLLILAGNIIGCLFVALIARCSPMQLQTVANGILEGRLATGPLCGGVLAIGCGFIMTTAVQFGREGKFLPLLFGVPVFIVCGFPHCIADAFYYLTVPASYLGEHILETLVFYIAIVIGNFIGCNLFRTVFSDYGKK
ncbi:MAG: formate/nitrite transporter family protein [Alistipes sp.]|nr:formate/nitrite transporter family protein [Candidatus Alistipes equi]